MVGTFVQGMHSYEHMSQQDLDNVFVHAVMRNNANLVETVLDAGAHIDQEVCYKEIEDGIDYCVRCSVFRYAAMYDCADALKVLLAKKTDFSKKEQLFWLALKQGSVNVVKLLMKMGINLNNQNRVGNTPLMQAIEYSDIMTQSTPIIDPREEFLLPARATMVQMLLAKSKLGVNHVNSAGYTPLMLAIKQYDFQAVQELLQVPGINVNYVNKYGDTALIIAARMMELIYASGDNRDYERCMQSQNIVNELLSVTDIDVEHRNKKGEKALEILQEKTERLKLYQEL